MTVELRDNAEARTMTPSGFESPRLTINNEEMAAFSGLMRQGGRVVDREQDMFGAGFSFSQAGLSDLYGSDVSKNDKLYLASNLTPNLPDLEQPRQLEPTQRQNINSDSIVWDPREWATKTAKQAGNQTKEIEHKLGRGADLAKTAKENPELQHHEGIAIFPHRGNEDDHVSYGACAAANNPFENIRMRIGSGPGHIDPNLIAGIMRNEQFFYKNVVDTGTDNYVRIHGNLDVMHDPTYSIGPAQMQIRNIESLIKQFPEQLGQYAKDPLRAAERSGDAPMFVAAYISNMINHLETGKNPGFSNGVWNNIVKHWKSGDANGALILTFNPDPNQIENVSVQLKTIETEQAKAKEAKRAKDPG
jgi:hypothetical protein